MVSSVIVPFGYNLFELFLKFLEGIHTFKFMGFFQIQNTFSHPPAMMSLPLYYL